MAKKKITNLVIVDASGSMASKFEAVKSGLTELFEHVNSDIEKGKAKLTTIVTQFSSSGRFTQLVNSKKTPIDFALVDNYRPSGMTALYDAIFKSFELVGNKQDGVFVSILTDGDENNSASHNLKDVKELIQAKREEGWAITFMGVDENAIQNAQNMGISRGNTLQYANDSVGTRSAMTRSSNTRIMYTESLINDKKIDTNNLMSEE